MRSRRVQRCRTRPPSRTRRPCSIGTTCGSASRSASPSTCRRAWPATWPRLPSQAIRCSNAPETVIVGSNLLACEAAAAEAAREMGFRSLVLTTFVEGEAREAGRVLAGVLREVDASGHPLERPCCIVAGGETTVTVRGAGRGGRNQELALAAAFGLRGLEGRRAGQSRHRWRRRSDRRRRGLGRRHDPRPRRCARSGPPAVPGRQRQLHLFRHASAI